MAITVNQNSSDMGIFYEIKDTNNFNRGYIYGTSHIIFNDPEFKINDRIKKAFAESAHFVAEANILKSKKLDVIGSNDEEKIKALKDFNAFQSPDLELLLNAYESKKNIKELETTEEQEDLLKEVKKELWKNTAQKYFKLPVLGDLTPEEQEFKTEFDEISKLKDIVHKTIDETIVERVHKHGISNEVYVKFNDERNAKMAEKIDRYLHEGSNYFIAVGAGHVVGETGLVSLLRQRGWTLQKIV